MDYFLRKIDYLDQWRVNPAQFATPAGIPSACLADLGDPDSSPSLWHVRDSADISAAAAALTLTRGTLRPFYGLVIPQSAFAAASKEPVFDGHGTTAVQSVNELHWTLHATTAAELLRLVEEIHPVAAQSGDDGDVGHPGIVLVLEPTLVAQILALDGEGSLSELNDKERSVLNRARKLAPTVHSP